MAIELVREAFKVEELKGNNEIQALVETEIYLSPTKPNIEKILWVHGKVNVLNTKLIKDKLIVSGVTRFDVLYNSVDEENNSSIQTLETSKEFREELDIDGADEDMVAKVKSKIEYLEYEIEESKVQLKALVNLWGEVEEYKNIEAIKQIKGNDSLQTLKETVNYKEVFGREISYAMVNDVIKLGDNYPEIDEIVKFSTKTREVESMVVEDRIITSGEIMANIIYFGQNKVHSYKTTIPFNHFLEMPGVNKNLMGNVEYEVVEGNYEIMGNELGERKLIDLEIKVKVTGKAFQDNTRELIIDAYSTKEKLSIEREEVNIRESLKDLKQIEDLKIALDVDADDILEVEGYVGILDKRVIDMGIEVEGVLSLDIEYIDRVTEDIMSSKEDVPFKVNIYDDLDPESIVDVVPSIDNIDYSLSRDGLEVDCKVLLNANLSKNRRIYGIKEVIETNETIDKKNKPSITVYIVQKGDVLWDIAKRYNTTTEDIIVSNNITNGVINPGDKIIIEKKIEEMKV
ncbi:SPOCS domain-containing protein [Tissierella sp. Yu-01]|uniref:DUF3794 and LysM peptidoglycan-binding domain-containing protein n=1 Tax=Tissierella sp. Yu-01 TaxID=3035694 RepID=UPI00240E6A7C|nr:SPOCS domain-containing protein [Tissierella sp. Yu-01]WFA08513.1 DUF3794 domain-containing protein [Tissierella sp. Yu-01]